MRHPRDVRRLQPHQPGRRAQPVLHQPPGRNHPAEPVCRRHPQHRDLQAGTPRPYLLRNGAVDGAGASGRNGGR